MFTSTETIESLAHHYRSLKKFHLIHDEYELIAGLEGKYLEQSYALRAKVFCHELRWVKVGAGNLETDIYDSSTITLGVVVRGELVGCLRVHPHWEQWMACTVFSYVTPNLAIRQTGTCEVSRLAVEPRYRTTNHIGNRRVSDLIYQCLYAFCVVNEIDTSYMIVSRRMLKSLESRGLLCNILTPENRIEHHRDSPILVSLNWRNTVGSVNCSQHFSYRSVAKLAVKECK